LASSINFLNLAQHPSRLKGTTIKGQAAGARASAVLASTATSSAFGGAENWGALATLSVAIVSLGMSKASDGVASDAHGAVFLAGGSFSLALLSTARPVVTAGQADGLEGVMSAHSERVLFLKGEFDIKGDLCLRALDVF
jgi:hypothetical protein